MDAMEIKESSSMTQEEAAMVFELNKNNPPHFKDKIDLVRSIIIDSVAKDVLKKVYLLGSYAYGNPNGASDIDICVIVDDNSEISDVSMAINKNMSKNNFFYYDLLLYNEKYFYGAKNPRGIEHTIMEKGKLLYGQ